MTLASNNQEMHWAQRNASRLPAGYREVAYIESSGTQYIDTNLANNQRLKMAAELLYTQENPRVQVFGFGGAWGNARLAFGMTEYSEYTNGFYAGIGSMNTGNLSFKIETGKRYRMYASTIDGTFGVDDQTYKTSYSFSNNARTILIFARRNNPNDCFCFCRLYTCTLENSSSMLRNFVPCVRAADRKPGMYDLCGSICPLTNTPFYINSGSSTDFTWGELQ